MFFHLSYMFLSQCTCYIVRGRVLGIRQGGTTQVTVLWCCMWGRGPRGNSATCSSLCQFSVTFPTTHNQIGPFWCWFPSGWTCVCSRTLWVSLKNSPVRLGVSPTAASTPTGVFNQRFEASFPHAGTLGCMVCLAPQLLLPVYLLANVGPPSLPALPSCPSPPLLLVWMNLSSLTPQWLEFHTVRLSGISGCFCFLICCCLSFGCARRHSVSTYTSILVGSPKF